MSDHTGDTLDSWGKNPGSPFPFWLIWVIVIVVFGLMILGMQS